ncbi:polyamine aminopropyltransferase [Cellulosimicrobium cellulans]|uniref:polyamine aminopropyltransferase n=1 Tax=Cellulosimicrobium cellulans TaxID=1710 RepID=UPI0024069DDB|nr:polyamine aminopropyltransferase [Cellulosimicrobium cellulans]MDF9875982.1 spermidine synthase [Cellulosimicrobium cellulans]
MLDQQERPPGRPPETAADGSGDAAPPSGRSGNARPMDRPTVFAAALLVAVGGLVYELILGTAASYLFGDSVVAFSVATGLTLFGMGLGSLLAPRFQRTAGLSFVRNELVLSLLGGTSVLVLFWAYASTELAWVVFVVLSLAIGTAIGVEIPLLVAVLKEQGSEGSVSLLSKVLALDYFGALAASLLFPFLLLPYLGLVRTAFAVAVLNVAVAAFMLARMGHPPRWTALAAVTLVVLLAGFATSTWLETRISAGMYQDPVVAQERSAYQQVVVTEYRGDTRLYLDNQLQFSSVDEARYHETLAHAAMTSVAAPASVVILGGGDGLLAREVLRYDSVQEVTLVDLDPAVTDLARENRLLTDLNEHALDDPRVSVVNADAFRWVQDTPQTFDVVLVDLVDPSTERVAKLYSQEFYGMVAAHLRPGGAFATQATSTYFTPDAFWQVVSTVHAAAPDRAVVPLTVNVPSFGEWGFVLSLPTQGTGTADRAGDEGAAPDDVPGLFARTPLPEGLRFHDAASLAATTHLPADNPPRDLPPSTLLSPTVQRTYQEDMRAWRY